LAVEKGGELISFAHSSFSYFSIELGFLVCIFSVRGEIEEKLLLMEV